MVNDERQNFEINFTSTVGVSVIVLWVNILVCDWGDIAIIGNNFIGIGKSSRGTALSEKITDMGKICLYFS